MAFESIDKSPEHIFLLPPVDNKSADAIQYIHQLVSRLYLASQTHFLWTEMLVSYELIVLGYALLDAIPFILQSTYPIGNHIRLGLKLLIP